MPELGRNGFAPSATLTGGAAAGTPLAIVFVWWLNTYVLTEPMPAEIATAAGSIVAAIVGYALQLLEAVRGTRTQ